MIFNASNCWNQDVSAAPVSPDSDRFIRYIGALSGEGGKRPAGVRGEWGPQHGRGRHYVVPEDAPLVPIVFDWPDASFKSGKAPIPKMAKYSFLNPVGDNIMILLRGQYIYELYAARFDGKCWRARCGVIFDSETSDALDIWGHPRPIPSASASDSGLCIMAGMVTWEDLNEPAGLQHAVGGLTWAQCGYVPPAIHGDIPADRAALPVVIAAPPNGTRLRLRADFDISDFQVTTQRLLTGLKQFGVILMDCSAWYDLGLTGTCDARWPADRGYHFDQGALAGINVDNFEVVTL
jgi:hypothetical protein